MICENCILLEKEIVGFRQVLFDAEMDAAEIEQRRDATYQKYVATFADLIFCQRDLIQLRQSLANLLV